MKPTRTADGRRAGQVCLWVALCLAVSALVGCQVLMTHATPRPNAEAGISTARWSVGWSGRAGASSRWAPRLPPSRPPSRAYFLPAELGVHHHTLSGASSTHWPLSLPVMRHLAAHCTRTCPRVVHGACHQEPDRWSHEEGNHASGRAPHTRRLPILALPITSPMTIATCTLLFLKRQRHSSSTAWRCAKLMCRRSRSSSP